MRKASTVELLMMNAGAAAGAAADEHDNSKPDLETPKLKHSLNLPKEPHTKEPTEQTLMSRCTSWL